jgi:fatty acid desaturase
MKFQVNEGSLDRFIRIAIGIVALNVAAVATGPLFWGALVVGLLGTVTGLTGFCPTYLPFGIDTRPKDRSAARRAEREV